jgi:two-component system chemotaxis response regulator CheY
MNKIPLMIVDDSMIIRQMITEAHNKDKYELVAVAKDGAEAIEQFVAHKPKIVTMDLTMPHIDGIRCIEELVGIDPEIQIIVVSALSDEATGIEALKKGASGFVNKPFTEEEICSAIDIIAEEL